MLAKCVRGSLQAAARALCHTRKSFSRQDRLRPRHAPKANEEHMVHQDRVKHRQTHRPSQNRGVHGMGANSSPCMLAIDVWARRERCVGSRSRVRQTIFWLYVWPCVSRSLEHEVYRAVECGSVLLLPFGACFALARSLAVAFAFATSGERGFGERRRKLRTRHRADGSSKQSRTHKTNCTEDRSSRDTRIQEPHRGVGTLRCNPAAASRCDRTKKSLLQTFFVSAPFQSERREPGG